MRRMVVKTEALSQEQIAKVLDARGILVNRYARELFAHPRFCPGRSGDATVAIASLHEIGLCGGATLDGILGRIAEVGLRPCPPSLGVFLRLFWTTQPQSRSAILSGTHAAPDRAVTVLSEPLEADDAFPKGLYLRNVGGNLWLRGYVCDAAYRFPADALFAFEVGEAGEARTARETDAT